MTKRFLLLAGAVLLALTSGGAIHGSSSYLGATWLEALEKVPCQDIIPIGKDDLKVNATVVVDGTSYANPTITDHKLVEEIDKHCHLKR
jgi:hypothetical protein